jgi:hypothetical protein
MEEKKGLLSSWLIKAICLMEVIDIKFNCLLFLPTDRTIGLSNGTYFA